MEYFDRKTRAGEWWIKNPIKAHLVVVKYSKSFQWHNYKKPVVHCVVNCTVVVMKCISKASTVLVYILPYKW